MILPTDSAARKAIPLASGLFDYFALALIEVAKVSHASNAKHNGEGAALRWDREKSSDHDDCLLRHFVDRDEIDAEGVPERARIVWRALAGLQIWCEQRRARAVADDERSAFTHVYDHETGHIEIVRG